MDAYTILGVEARLSSKEFRERYQCLQKAISGASASVGIATAFISDALNSKKRKEAVDVIADDLNVICDAKELKIDQRAMSSFLCCCLSARW